MSALTSARRVKRSSARLATALEAGAGVGMAETTATPRARVAKRVLENEKNILVQIGRECGVVENEDM